MKYWRNIKKRLAFFLRLSYNVMRGVHMNFDLRRFFSEHGPLLVGVTALAVAVTAATVPAALKRDASAITMYPTGDGYPPIYETTEKTGCALYIDGTLVAVSESSYELEAAVDKVATELSVKENKDAEDYSIISCVEYKNGEFSVSDFTDDIASAVRASGLSVCGVVTKSITSVLESETVYRDNTDMTDGSEKVIVPGKDGEVSEVYRLYYNDGKIYDTQIVSIDVVTPAVDTVVERGVKLASDRTLTSLSMFIMPYNGGISSEYGRRYLLGSVFHGGVDVAGKVAGTNCYGETIVAAGDGVVVEAGYHGDFGKLVVIEHPNGIRTYYAHMSKITVSKDDEVRQGEKIGNIGNTGKVEGPHVHFEVRLPDKNGVYYRVDPKYYIIDYSSYLR